MKQHGFLFSLFSLFVTSLVAQQIGNVRAEQDGNKIIILYDIVNLPVDHLVDIDVYVSIDGEAYLGPLRSVSGDVGKDNTGGRGKRIVWNVLEERQDLKSSKVTFKVQGRIYDGKIFEMVFVEGGEYIQGSFKDYDEKPLHSVYINDFFIGKFEVTQRQWKSVMGYNPSFFNYCEECPVENVSYKDLDKFLQELNRQTGLNYRLPTEAEWEYAAKGGNKSLKYVFSGGDNPDGVAWYAGNNNQHTRKPGTKSPNELGIYDMSGNVMEWCADWYSKTYYHDAPYKNPLGPNTGSHRVVRGGSWSTGPNIIRCTNRGYATQGSRYDDLGFRLARDAD